MSIKKKSNYWDHAKNGKAIFKKCIQQNTRNILNRSIADEYEPMTSCLFCRVELQSPQVWVHMISHYAAALEYYHSKGLPCSKRKAYNFLLHINLVEGLNGGNPIKEGE